LDLSERGAGCQGGRIADKDALDGVIDIDVRHVSPVLGGDLAEEPLDGDEVWPAVGQGVAGVVHLEDAVLPHFHPPGAIGPVGFPLRLHPFGFQAFMLKSYLVSRKDVGVPIPRIVLIEIPIVVREVVVARVWALCQGVTPACVLEVLIVVTPYPIRVDSAIPGNVGVAWRGDFYGLPDDHVRAVSDAVVVGAAEIFRDVRVRQRNTPPDRCRGAIVDVVRRVVFICFMTGHGRATGPQIQGVGP